MDSFKFRNHDVKFSKIKGDVLDTNKFSETHVSSYAGSKDHAPTVSSTTITTHEFWVREESGKEKSVTIIDRNVPLRAGHNVSVLYAGSKHGKMPVAIANNTTGERSVIYKAKKINKLLLDKSTYGTQVFCTLFFGYLIGIFTGDSIVFWAVFGTAVLSIIVKGLQLAISKRKLDAHIAELAKTI